MEGEKQPIDLYRAIDEMKRISLAGGIFSLRFRKWDRQRRNGGEMVYVPAARLRPKASDEEIANASFKLFFVDTDTGMARNCWQMLIMEFNGHPTVLN